MLLGAGNVEQVFNLLRIRAQVENLCYGELCYWGLCYRIGSVSIGTGGPGAICAPGGSCSGGIGAP